jgi:acetyltransferase AlgX (SGNH hydrolase-like protein)
MFFWSLVLAIALTWIAYLSVGQQIITALFNSEDSALADRWMAGRAVTPVDAYYRRADAVMVHATLWLVASYVAAGLLLRHALGLFLSGLSFLVSSFLLFCVFEAFPSLIALTHLDGLIGYYAYQANYIQDPELVFREKPFNRRIIRDFTGTQYSPVYGIEVEPYTLEWIMDKDGFRNQRKADSTDVVVLGDSYIEYGSTEADTFVGRLEKRLGKMTVRNLGKSGYAPGQYLQVLKRFGLPHKPKIAVMAFYEGNDIPEVRDYLLWKNGRTSELRGYLFQFATDSLWRRYRVAVMATLVELRKVLGAFDEISLQKLAAARGYPQRIHPDVAILDLGGRLYPKLFIDKLPETATEQMLANDELRAIKNFFREFREVCNANRVTPVLLYIPTALGIYAPYSTQASGSQWLAVRARQIAVRGNIEKAITLLATESHVDLISLTPEFQRAAAEGKMIYYALDAHWNAEGREIAARFVADALHYKYLPKQK